MIEVWTFRVEVVPAAGAQPDLTGYSVQARDGEVGTISDASYERERSYLVVDTGGLIGGRDVLLPAGTVERVDEDERAVHVGLTKDEIEGAPPLALEDRTPEDELRLGEYYAGRAA